MSILVPLSKHMRKHLTLAPIVSGLLLMSSVAGFAQSTDPVIDKIVREEKNNSQLQLLAHE
jgi:hypothetical protein